MVQTSAHGAARPAVLDSVEGGSFSVRFAEPQRRTAGGQTVVLYDESDHVVVAGGIAR
jgi:tRNA U34 2-thiouridine synthase MnmA/TrmU